MGKLTINQPDGMTEEFSLDKERVTLGRHADNDICLNDKAVSGHHAVIVTVLHDSFLEDLNSTNGTLVNGRQIAKHALATGDTIQIGRAQIVYQGQAQGDSEDFEKTMILRPSEIAKTFPVNKPVEATPAAAKPAAHPESDRPQTGKLRVVSGPNTGKELDLTKALTTVGKPGVQVAAITRRADGYYIVHVGGSGGGRPVVNGAEIDTQARRLNNGDTIDIAGTQMSFLLG
jgi:pSer/pThr/pTyr-binding forkhead associated (FHA) protein